MKQQIKLSFYGPNKFDDNQQGVNTMLETVLSTFMQEKGINDYKVNKVEYKERTFTKIIGTYLYHGLAEVEFKESELKGD